MSRRLALLLVAALGWPGIVAAADPAKPAASANADVKIEASLMSWRAMDEVASAIAKGVTDATQPLGLPCIVVVTSPDAVTDANVHAFVAGELERLGAEFKRLSDKLVREKETPKALEGLIADLENVSKALNSVLGIVQMFRTDITLEGVAVSNDAEALAAMVAGRIRSRDDCGRSRLLSLSGGSRLVRLLVDVRTNRALALKHAGTDEFKALEARLTAVVGVLMADEPGTKRPMAGRLALAETLADADARTLVLFVKPVVMGGTNQERTGFFVPNTVSHSGGAAATFVLARRDGSVLASDTFWSYDGYARNPTRKKVESSAFKSLGGYEAKPAAGAGRP